METWVMWGIGLGVVILPFVLMRAFNGENESDSRGRRLDRTWRVHKN